MFRNHCPSFPISILHIPKFLSIHPCTQGFTGGLVVKNMPGQECRRHKDAGLIPGLGKSSGEGHVNPLQYSGLGNSMNSGSSFSRLTHFLPSFFRESEGNLSPWGRKEGSGVPAGGRKLSFRSLWVRSKGSLTLVWDSWRGLWHSQGQWDTDLTMATTVMVTSQGVKVGPRRSSS